MKSHRIDKAALATVLLALVAASGSAMAQDKDTKWEKHHPRREQVNKRLEKGEAVVISSQAQR